MDNIKSLYWICYDIASILCFVFFGCKASGSLISDPACWISVPWPGIKSVSPNPCVPALEPQSLKHWAAEEVPGRHNEKKNFYWEFFGDSVVIGPSNFSSGAQVQWLGGELGSKESCSRSKVETRLHGEGVRWGREIWKNTGRLLRGRTKAGKRRNPRPVKFFQIITFPRMWAWLFPWRWKPDPILWPKGMETLSPWQPCILRTARSVPARCPLGRIRVIGDKNSSFQFSSVAQLYPTLCDSWTAHHASLSITNPQSLLKLMSIELVIPSSHLTLCRPLLLLPSTFPSIRVFSNESALRIRWPKYWSFTFNISPSNEHPGLISFRMDWLDHLAVQGTLKSLLQHHSSHFILKLSSHSTTCCAG